MKNKTNLPLMHIVLMLAALMTASMTIAAPLQGPAPDFTLKSNDGTNLKLSELRGQVVMINFWASWCGPCRQEMPLLDKLYQRYSPVGFTILGVNVEDDPAKAQTLLKEYPVSFPILFDSDNAVSKRYGLSAMPSTIFIDRDGNLRSLHKGYLPGYEDAYEKQVKALIRE